MGVCVGLCDLSLVLCREGGEPNEVERDGVCGLDDVALPAGW